MNECKPSVGEIAAWSIAMAILGALLCYALTQTFIGAGKAIVYVTGEATDRQAESDCIGWALEATRHDPYSEANPGGYFLTKWQKEECDSVNIHINVPVL